VVGGFDPCLSFFFLIFLFFFFLFTGLLASELSLDEEDEMEGDLASEEGEEDLIGEEGEGSTWGWCSWGEVLTTKALTAFGLPEWKTTIPIIQLWDLEGSK
jgi:hypothetical protein